MGVEGAACTIEEDANDRVLWRAEPDFHLVIGVETIPERI